MMGRSSLVGASGRALRRLLEGGLGLGPLLDAVELVLPQSLELARPVVHGPQLLRLEAIHTFSATPGGRHEANVPEHREVLGDAGLSDAQFLNELPHHPLTTPGQDLQDLAPAWLADGSERVAGGRGTGHG